MIDNVYCRNCKTEIAQTVQICPRCGCDQQFRLTPANESNKNLVKTITGVAALLAIGGCVFIGVHQATTGTVDKPHNASEKRKIQPPSASSGVRPNSNMGTAGLPTRDQLQPGPGLPSGQVKTDDTPTANVPPEQPAPSDRTNASLGTEPLPQPPVQMRGKAHIGNAHFSFENDGHGNEQCVGRVLVVNDGPYAITDFRLSLGVLSGDYALVPFEGSLRLPSPIYYRRIEPGSSMDVPVMTTGIYSSFSVYGLKSVSLEASVDGPPGVVWDKKSLD